MLLKLRGAIHRRQTILDSDWPDYSTDHADCHALKVWLAGQEYEGSMFLNILARQVIPDRDGALTRAALHQDTIWKLLTADPAIIAEAAWRSIQKEKSD